MMSVSQQLQKHLVFGAGQIGGFVGSCLGLQGFDVALAARPKLARRYALPIECSDLDGHVATIDALRCVDTSKSNESSTEVFDVIWLTVKCISIQAALDDLRPFIAEHTVILCCQNGLGSDHTVRDAFPSNQVLRVMVPFNVVDLNASEIETVVVSDLVADAAKNEIEPQPLRWCRTSEGGLHIELHPAILALASKLNCDLLPVSCVQDMEATLWAKLQLNLANPVNALAGLPIKSMLENRNFRKLIAGAMDEQLAVTDAMNLALPKLTRISAHWVPRVLRLPNWLFSRVAQQMLAIDPQARVSMWWDIQQGRLTEIEYLNGAVVAKAKTLGLTCPINQKLVEQIHQLERGEKTDFALLLAQ